MAAWEDLDQADAPIIDVRSPEEFKEGNVPGSANIPLNELRGRLDELPKDKELWVICGVGQRSYYAARLLLQHGFTVRELSGGTQIYGAFRAAGLLAERR